MMKYLYVSRDHNGVVLCLVNNVSAALFELFLIFSDFTLELMSITHLVFAWTGGF